MTDPILSINKNMKGEDAKKEGIDSAIKILNNLKSKNTIILIISQEDNIACHISYGNPIMTMINLEMLSEMLKPIAEQTFNEIKKGME